MKKLLLPFFITGTIIMMYIMATTGAGLKTMFTPNGIIDLEFAYNSTKTEAILKAWDCSPIHSLCKIHLAKINTYFDFVFLFFYAGLLFLACKKIALNNKGWFEKAGHMIAKGAIAAGLLDILENLGMLITLHGSGSSTIAFATTFVSIIKWILALIAVLYVLSGLLVWVWKKLRS